MAHQRHLEKEKYRQWVKAGLGLGYLKEGLAPFCNGVTKQQHKEILNDIQQTKTLQAVACDQCAVRTLKPDHDKVGKNQCPFGQDKCNCCYTSGKIACPNDVCGAIYDAVITNHASTPPAPYWNNTQTQKWTEDPWSLAKCFINAPGYEQKTSAANTDCTGLLHVIINNKYFHKHVQWNSAGANLFSKVRQYRNEIFHSSSMELEEANANSYIDDMIAVLKDGTELINRTDAQEAVKKLEELKNEDFIITTENMKTVLEDMRKDIEAMKKSTEGLATKDDCDDLKTKISTLESLMLEQTEEMKRLETDRLKKEQSDYEDSKLDLQTRLIEFYVDKILHMSALPLQPEDNVCDFKDIYVRPRMTTESKDDKSSKVLSMSDIFTKDGKAMRSIYILGEAGSGKSSFCKSLVNYWCLAHSDEGDGIGDGFCGVNEMKRFTFLFLLPLRHYTDKTKIKEMLEEKYEHPVLKKVLERESRTCLVVLDGLDEWDSPASKCPPERDSMKGYTVITTSRPWKIATLGISDNEIRQKIIIEGFCDKTSVRNMAEQTITTLNKTFKKDKDPGDCERALTRESFTSLKQTAITLQQLICLWYDDRLHDGISRSALYTKMLDLLFDWHKQKYPYDPLFKEMRKNNEDLQNVKLPRYLTETEVCKSYSYIIRDVSRLAYKSLFNYTKETSLSFDSSTFERFIISDKIKTCCLQLGILSEDKCPGFSASKSRKPVISFVHKTFQEYLAAVHIAIHAKNYMASSIDSENPDLSDHCAQLLKNYFKKCTTLDGILEQANVFIMLCGLEPGIASSISKYIYDIVSRDKRVVEYRQGVADKDRHEKLILNIQGCILNCIKEVQAFQTHLQSNIYLGDILDNGWVTRLSDLLCTSIENQLISRYNVISFTIDTLYTFARFRLQYLKKCQRLEAICIIHGSKINGEDIKSICDAIEANTSTLKALSIESSERVCRTIFSCLPDMCRLVALKIRKITMRREDFISLCTFLSGSSRLEQLSITDIGEFCIVGIFFSASFKENEVDLSKHQHLEYLEYDSSIVVTGVNTSKLETINCRLLNGIDCVKVFDTISTANRLTQLCLGYDRRNVSYHTITEKMISVLPSLHQLRELSLHNFTLTDNIMKCPSEMKSLKIIGFGQVRMSLTTWRQFVDSLHLMPLPVNVKAMSMCITRDGEDCNTGIHTLIAMIAGEAGGEEAAAWQYVRQHEALFNVEYEDEEHNSITFCSSV